MSDDAQNPVTLVTVPGEIEAAAIVTALADYGIVAHAAGGYVAGFRAEAPGDVAIYVRQADRDVARQALAEIRQDQAAVDWSQIDVEDSEQ